MSLPTYPAVDLSQLTDHELARLATYLNTAAAAVTATQTARADATARERHARAYTLTLGSAALDWWTPEPWHSATIIQGTHQGRHGFIVGECADGCQPIAGHPRYRLHNGPAQLLITCIPRQILAPRPTCRGKGNRIL